MKKIILTFILLFNPFYVLADSYDEVMKKYNLNFNDIKLLYNSERPEHRVYLKLYFRGLLEGIMAYDSMIVLEKKNRVVCISAMDGFMKLGFLSNNIEMIDNFLETTQTEYLAEHQPFTLLYMRTLQYNYPCEK